MSVQTHVVRKKIGISPFRGSWIKILSLTLACVLLAGAVIGAVQITRANPEQWLPEQGIVEFERANPVHTATADVGTLREELQLPGALRAVCVLPDGPGEGFRQTAPQPGEGGNFDYYWYGYVAPKEEAALRAAGGLVVYTIYYADGHEAWRVHGTYNGLDEGFYACDQAGNVTGFVTFLPAEWTGSYNAQQEGTYTLTAKLAGASFSGVLPTAEITVSDFSSLSAVLSCGSGECGEGCDDPSHSHIAGAPMPASAPPEPLPIPPLSDCACGIDSTSRPWEHNVGCQYYAAPACTCPGGKHDPGNKDCLTWQPPLIMPTSIGGGGANDVSGDNTMTACAPTSGNAA